MTISLVYSVDKNYSRGHLLLSYTPSYCPLFLLTLEIVSKIPRWSVVGEDRKERLFDEIQRTKKNQQRGRK